MPRTNFQELLDAGAHFGHLKRKWNPKMGTVSTLSTCTRPLS